MGHGSVRQRKRHAQRPPVRNVEGPAEVIILELEDPLSKGDFEVGGGPFCGLQFRS